MERQENEWESGVNCRFLLNDQLGKKKQVIRQMNMPDYTSNTQGHKNMTSKEKWCSDTTYPTLGVRCVMIRGKLNH